LFFGGGNMDAGDKIAAFSIFGGDANLNNVVDAADYVLWRKNLGLNVTPGTNGDVNFNGVVDSIDYRMWRQFFGANAPAGAGALGDFGAAVPEPTSFALVAIGAVAFLSRRRSTER
jgi:hypothetical protein